MTVVADRLAGLSAEQKRTLLADMLRARAEVPKQRPLSPGQRRLWFFEQLEPGTSVLNIPFVLHLRGRLDAGALERALSELAARHETLRTAFAIPASSSEPVQVIVPASHRTLPLVDLTAIPLDERERAAERAHREDAAHPFDLFRAPLWRATLLRLAADRHDLVVTLHHLVGDGFSLRVFIQDLSALYEAFASGRPSPLDPLPIQYGYYAARQVRALEEGSHLDDLAYWRARLGGRLPADWTAEDVRRKVEAARKAAAPELEGLPVAAFPAAAYATLAGPYAAGAIPTELSKRARLTWAVLRGRI